MNKTNDQFQSETGKMQSVFEEANPMPRIAPSNNPNPAFRIPSYRQSEGYSSTPEKQRFHRKICLNDFGKSTKEEGLGNDHVVANADRQVAIDSRTPPNGTHEKAKVAERLADDHLKDTPSTNNFRKQRVLTQQDFLERSNAKSTPKIQSLDERRETRQGDQLAQKDNSRVNPLTNQLLQNGTARSPQPPQLKSDQTVLPNFSKTNHNLPKSRLDSQDSKTQFPNTTSKRSPQDHPVHPLTHLLSNLNEELNKRPTLAPYHESPNLKFPPTGSIDVPEKHKIPNAVFVNKIEPTVFENLDYENLKANVFGSQNRKSHEKIQQMNPLFFGDKIAKSKNENGKNKEAQTEFCGVSGVERGSNYIRGGQKRGNGEETGFDCEGAMQSKKRLFSDVLNGQVGRRGLGGEVGNEAVKPPQTVVSKKMDSQQRRSVEKEDAKEGLRREVNRRGLDIKVISRERSVQKRPEFKGLLEELEGKGQKNQKAFGEGYAQWLKF